jgi:hypothetical protein
VGCTGFVESQAGQARSRHLELELLYKIKEAIKKPSLEVWLLPYGIAWLIPHCHDGYIK